MFRSLMTLPRTLLAAGALAVAAVPGLAAAQNLPPVSLPTTKSVPAANTAKPHDAKPHTVKKPAKAKKPLVKKETKVKAKKKAPVHHTAKPKKPSAM